MSLDRDRLKDMTRTELYRVMEEFMAERDAHKRDAERAISEWHAAAARVVELERELYERANAPAP